MRDCLNFPMFIRIGLVGLVLGSFGGCSSEDDLSTSMDDDFKTMEKRIRFPSSGTMQWGEDVGMRVAGLGDLEEQRRCLEKFRRTIIGFKLEIPSYSDRANQLSIIEDFAETYELTLRRCRKPIEEVVDFRLDVLSKIKRDIDRMSEIVVSNPKDTVIGLHWSADMYLTRLKNSYELNLRRLEEQFNDMTCSRVSPARQQAIRQKIERVLGRRIRTNKEIQDQLHAQRKLVREELGL